jgi:hypothetical protein
MPICGPNGNRKVNWLPPRDNDDQACERDVRDRLRTLYVIRKGVTT